MPDGYALGQQADLALDFAPEEEALLVDRAKKHDREAWEVLYERYYQLLLRYALARVHRLQDAEDIVSQTFLRAWQSLRRYDYRGRPFVAWLYRIAQNLVKDQARGRRRHPETHLGDLQDGTLLTDADAVLTRLDLLAAVERLRPEQREVVVLRFLVGLPTRDVAQLLGKSQPAISSLQVRALESLRKALK